MWGHRVVIPEQMLSLVHRSHLGIVKTKSLISSYFWWPNIDKDVDYTKPCHGYYFLVIVDPFAKCINVFKT